MTNAKRFALGLFAATAIVSLPVSAEAATIVASFDGLSQGDAFRLGGAFRPPDTMGAIGTTQYVSLLNGAYAVFDRAGNRLQELTPAQFFANAGVPGGSGGDSRVLFDTVTNRWLAIAFGSTNNKINIAVSDTDNALGGWKGTSYAVIPSGTADYPTLAIDNDAVYVGTNNFTPGFSSVSLVVFDRDNIFAAAGPSTANSAQFNTPGATDRGFAIQGVNSTDGDGVGRVVAASNQFFDSLTYNVNNPGTAGATQSAVQYLNESAYTFNNDARQPYGFRTIDTLDDRISGNAWEMNGKIYFAKTVNEGDDHTRIRVVVMDAATGALLSETDIADPNYDFYQGSLAVNSDGTVVVGYNRSGSNAADGKVRIYARVYDTNANGTLSQTDELFIKESEVDDYRCGARNVLIDTACRQRWGDYAAVNLDPTNNKQFWVIGEYAKEWFNYSNDPNAPLIRAQWGTWIAAINVMRNNGVPEPATWAMLLLGFGMVGSAYRRRRTQVSFSAA